MYNKMVSSVSSNIPFLSSFFLQKFNVNSAFFVKNQALFVLKVQEHTSPTEFSKKTLGFCQGWMCKRREHFEMIRFNLMYITYTSLVTTVMLEKLCPTKTLGFVDTGCINKQRKHFVNMLIQLVAAVFCLLSCPARLHDLITRFIGLNKHDHHDYIHFISDLLPTQNYIPRICKTKPILILENVKEAKQVWSKWNPYDVLSAIVPFFIKFQ